MISTRAKLALFGLVLASLLTIIALQLLDRAHDDDVGKTLDRRAIEISSIVSSSLDSPATLPRMLETLTRHAEITSIIVVDVSSGDVIEASSDDDSEPWTAAQLARVLPARGEQDAETPLTAEDATRLVGLSEDGGKSGYSLAVLIEFDRAGMGGSYNDLRQLAVAAILVTTVLVILATYLAFGRLVERPLAEAGRRLSVTAGLETDRASDPVAGLVETVDKFVGGSEVKRAENRIVVDRLPAMWVELDSDLAVHGVHVEDADVASSSFDEIQRLDDLLSDDVVKFVRNQLADLGAGETSAFGFSIGHRDYDARLACDVNGAFELTIVEASSVIREMDRDEDRSAEALDQLLGQLPFTLLELDQRGTVRWASASYVGFEPIELTDRNLTDVLPQDASRLVRAALRDTTNSGEPTEFVLEVVVDHEPRRWSNVAVSYSDGVAGRLLLAAIEVPESRGSNEADAATVKRLEEQLWTAELRVSELEAQVDEYAGKLADTDHASRASQEGLERLRDQLLDPVRAMIQALDVTASSEAPSRVATPIPPLRGAVEELTSVLDSAFGTSLKESIGPGYRPAQERFHVATFLDEIAIAAGQASARTASRISVRVQPSLPNWLYGDVTATRVGIHQMIEIARMVASDRPLTLAARQDAGTGRSVQVRFEVEIPPPQLDADALNVVRGCLASDDMVLSEKLLDLNQAATLPDFNPLDIELLTSEDGASVLRCSSAFEIAEEPESDHSWIRGLRTLIVQDPTAREATIQSALGAFGIIGYVVSDERDLIQALRLAEEYSNPYRFVIADIDTPELESFIGQLFDGDAPVVLVGPPSENAMVAALADGYAGYLSKPVRQVDLLEVILSTVEPAGQSEGQLSADAA